MKIAVWKDQHTGGWCAAFFYKDDPHPVIVGVFGTRAAAAKAIAS